MKPYRMIIEAYFQAEDDDDARKYMDDFDSIEWDAYTVHPPIQVLKEPDEEASHLQE